MEREMPHIVYTERSEAKRKLIRTDGALYVLLLLGALGAIALSRILANRFSLNRLAVQIGLYSVLLGTGYWIYRMRLVDYLYELYDTELHIVQVVGSKQKLLLTVPLGAITEVGQYRKTDAKQDSRLFHGLRKETTAVWYTQNGERRVLCLSASETLKGKLMEAANGAE